MEDEMSDGMVTPPGTSELKEEKEWGNGAGKRKRDKIHRRSRWACDDCRGRKIKCDGKMPCLPCQLAHQECTYTFQRKSKYSGPLYIQELEEKVKSLEYENQNLSTALQTVFPHIDLQSPNLAETLQEYVRDAKKTGQRRYKPSAEMHQPLRAPEKHSETSSPGELLETMIEAVGRLSVDEEGHCQYHGDFAGIAFLHQIDERCSQLLGVNRPIREPFYKNPLQQAFGSANVSLYRPRADPRIMFNLPPKATAQQFTSIALGNASSLMNFIHAPSFNNLLNQIYGTKPENYSTEELAFLPLLYLTLAIGELFSDSHAESASTGGLNQMKGVKWFRAGQALIDTANCRNMYSLQALVCIIIYLQSSALMHSCYSYISIAISVSLQMGLHRSEVSTRLDPIEQETRRRVFWVLQTMETYVTTLLGLPTVLEDEDIDQELPSCNEGNVMRKRRRHPEPATSCPMAPVVAHIKLVKIMRRIVKQIYPRTLRPGTGRAYRVNYGRIIKFEAELDEWFKNIPAPSQSESLQQETLRTQLLLRLAYAHVQMVLYRPFILHVIRTTPSDPPEMRSFACASACIKAAMQIVWLVEELETRGLLISAYWFTVYITFFAVMALCMFIISNPDDPTVDDALGAAEKGRRILTRLATNSVPAEKCVASLGTLFDKISLLSLEHRQSRESTSAISPTQPMIQPAPLPLMKAPTFNTQPQTHNHPPPAPSAPQNQGLHTILPNDSGVDLPSQPSHPSLAFTSPSQHQHPDFTTTTTRTLYIDTQTQIQPQPQTLQHPQPQHQSLHQAGTSGSLLTTTYPPLSGYHTHTNPQALPLPLSNPMATGGPDHRLFASPSAHEYFPYFDAGFDPGLDNTGLDTGWEEGGLLGD
ncbi:hypothetical protein EG329_014310 [Mollisiaceae sp. DMI_Dod_QoI]|nr:hypothetical protein EG329_014310 [Helotiales sp. DMI_Dod_QoI]